jgi:hypothetical protein
MHEIAEDRADAFVILDDENLANARHETDGPPAAARRGGGRQFSCCGA